MRSEYVFAAAKKISNRFMLCRVTSVSARRLHIDSKQSSETINKSLRLIAAKSLVAKPDRADEELHGDSGHVFLSPEQALSGNGHAAELFLETTPVSQPKRITAPRVVASVE